MNDSILFGAILETPTFFGQICAAYRFYLAALGAFPGSLEAPHLGWCLARLLLAIGAGAQHATGAGWPATTDT